MNLRHGAVLAIGEIVLSLSELEALDKHSIFLNESLLLLINGLVSQFYNRGQYRGVWVLFTVEVIFVKNKISKKFHSQV